jgi:branched-chain amino acid transport system ATP-binding protein
MSATLEFENVSLRQGGQPMLDGLGFTAPGGRLTGVLGQNGSGVAEVMALAGGAARPADGRILLDGAALGPNPVAAAAQGVARCARQPRGIVGMTALEQAMTGGFARRPGVRSSLLGLPAARRAERALAERAGGLLARVGLQARAEEPAQLLRRGDLWRLDLARALAGAPRLLLLEAPSAALRDADAAALGRLLRALCEEGLTVLVGERNMGFVAAHCHHAVILQRGRLLAEGSPQDCLDRPDVQEALLGRQEDADRLRARH